MVYAAWDHAKQLPRRPDAADDEAVLPAIGGQTWANFLQALTQSFITCLAKNNMRLLTKHLCATSMKLNEQRSGPAFNFSMSDEGFPG